MLNQLSNKRVMCCLQRQTKAFIYHSDHLRLLKDEIYITLRTIYHVTQHTRHHKCFRKCFMITVEADTGHSTVLPYKIEVFISTSTT